jgi:hypothetical protein
MTADLSQRMLHWCQQHQWYGAELDFRRFASTADHERQSFTHPPATSEQVETAETLLGYPLPTTLTTLYQHLANGGFGPAYGLRGLDPEDDESLVSRYRDWYRPQNRTLSELSGERLFATPPQSITLHYRQWPRGLVPICNWGCGSEICVDCTTPEGRVIHVGPAKEDRHLLLTGLAPSFEDWILAWLARVPEP